MTQRFAQHPLRMALHNEIHSRPFIVLAAPARLSMLAVWLEGPPGDAEYRHLAALCEHFGVAAPADGVRHFDVDFGGFRFKWERHGEFATLVVACPGARHDAPFSPAAARALPDAWLAGLPGQVIAAMHLALLPDSDALQDAQRRAEWFAHPPTIGMAVGGGALRAYTDFRIGEDGFSRWLLVDAGGEPRQIGRDAQRLCEIEAYRMMAMMAFPLAQSVGKDLDMIERDLGRATVALASAAAADDAALLASLADQAVRIERLAHRTSFRFGATRAYHDLVQRRLRDLREERLPGVQPISGFLDRRMGPAMATVDSVGRRLDDLARRLTRANALLRARVDLNREQQNQRMLDALNRRGELQLRLQQTVEGLSVAAITYYATGLVGYVAKAAKTAGVSAANPDLVAGLAVVPVALAVAWFTHRLRHRLTAGIEPAAHAPLKSD